MKVLVTGGAGYIGSHTCVELINEGHQPIIIDNLDNSNQKAVDRIKEITGVAPLFYKEDVRNGEALDRIFKENEIDAVIHFAGLKAVGESVREPLEYYDNNLVSTLVLLEKMREYGVKKLVFSSSATVYGLVEEEGPLKEELPTKAINPYGWTKVFIEQMLRDLAASDKEWSVVLLRYFNPLGAHKSGLIGEDPSGIPNNLLPYIAQVAVGRLERLNVFGNDYNTPDGTGVRDYIHVVDLAKGHIKALEYAEKSCGCEAVNLGTGKGSSVLEVKDAFERVSGVKIPFVIGPRRPGDPDAVYADVEKSQRLLGWKAEKTLEDMCRDSWNWQSKNPNGYKE